MPQTEPLPDLQAWLSSLPSDLDSEPGFADVLAALAAGSTASVDGAWGSACALTVAALTRHAPQSLLVVCESPKAADSLLTDLPTFDESMHFRFPAWTTDPGERLVYDETYAHRLSTLKQLIAKSQLPSSEQRTRTARLIVTSIQSLLQPVPPQTAVTENTRWLRVGESFDLEALSRWFVQHGFHNTSAVELPGEFAVRGGIMDIFAADWPLPIRVEFFGDEIESIRTFDVATQRSLEPRGAVDVTMLPPGGSDPMRASNTSADLLSYLADGSWIVLLEPERIEKSAAHYLERHEDQHSLLGIRRIMQRVDEFGHVGLTSLATETAEASCRLSMESVERFSGDVHQVRTELERAGQQKTVMLFCDTEAEQERLGEIFGETLLARDGRLRYPLGALSAGFHWSRQQLLLVSGAQLFGRTNLQRTAGRVAGRKIDTFLDLREGDLVVHLSHGIGRYRGMDVLPRENQIEEHLVLEFAAGTKIYVPATKIDLVQKYVGGSKARPKLAKIGGQGWVARKKAAASAVTDMAAELLEAQAQRAMRPGIAFHSDTHWQTEFDASFPYDETPDQLVAIDAIKRDMEAPLPMDRLLCGDVGFGKTEVAMRAAFKAVDNGFQVAVLVPTTVLAEQHFATFRSRIAEFPHEIAKLSRFCTTSETRETLKRLSGGQVDIVIGTHRLASKDVMFQNLGLLIIDEEQRFGVEVKERLKALRSTVDVLTMTATPIPRTLHMSMTGLRDISNLETPPEERVAVETRISRWNDDLIRAAIVRELDREGQIYFVHNRIADIEAVRAKLQQIVPDASIRIGHGQMHEADLEEVMVDFVTGEFDILLATTIVESGLDIPNANTIFIDNADRYGLSDLHQLRGRVGRFKHRAYCYLLLEPHKHITSEAARRLRAIEEFSEMGAGFAIAMRDLEFRGAGNVLGSQQSGHIAAVGYELYCELLESAVRRMQRLPPKLKVDVNIDLPGEAYLPGEYVPLQRAKIDFYRRLARIESEDDLLALNAELVDRFGPLPEATKRLMALGNLKVDAAIWQIEGIRIEDGYLVFDFTDESRIRQLAKLTSGKLRVVDSRSAYVTLDADQQDPDSILQVAQSVLRPG